MSTQKSFACGLGPALEAIAGKWKAVILWELGEGPLRYGELRRRLEGVSEKMINQQLRAMQRDGLVMRTALARVPPVVDYRLTDRGRDLNGALSALADWGEAHAKATGRYGLGTGDGN